MRVKVEGVGLDVGVGEGEGEGEGWSLRELRLRLLAFERLQTRAATQQILSNRVGGAAGAADD